MPETLFLLTSLVASLVSLVQAPGELPAQKTNQSDAKTSQPDSAKTAAQIKTWVRDLGSSRLTLRRTAKESLLRAGVPAVDPLVQAFRKPDTLEVQLHIEHILARFLKSEDEELQAATKKALAKVADSGEEDREIARWANAMLVTAQRKDITGTLRATDPKDSVRQGHPHQVHSFKMEKGRTYVIDLVARFDTYLRLEDSRGKNLAMDDDGGEGLNSRIIFPARETDDYRIIVTNFSPQGLGNYSLSIQFQGR